MAKNVGEFEVSIKVTGVPMMNVLLAALDWATSGEANSAPDGSRLATLRAAVETFREASAEDVEGLGEFLKKQFIIGVD